MKMWDVTLSKQRQADDKLINTELGKLKMPEHDLTFRKMDMLVRMGMSSENLRDSITALFREGQSKE